MWTDFIDWNNFNEELIRQAFDKPNNLYVDEYEYKPSFGLALFGGRREPKTFQEKVEENKSTIRHQIRKLRRFYE